MIPGEMIVAGGFCAAVYGGWAIQILKERKGAKNMKKRNENKLSLKKQRNALSEVISSQHDEIKRLKNEIDKLTEAKFTAEEKAGNYKWQMELLRAENAKLERENSILMVENIGTKKDEGSMTVTAVEFKIPNSGKKSIFTERRQGT